MCLLFPTVSCCHGDCTKHVLFVYLQNYISHNPNVCHLFMFFFVMIASETDKGRERGEEREKLMMIVFFAFLYFL